MDIKVLDIIENEIMKIDVEAMTDDQKEEAIINETMDKVLFNIFQSIGQLLKKEREIKKPGD